jgi:hypothetical protein
MDLPPPADPEPPQQRPASVRALVIAILVVSLLGNGALAVRLRDQRAESARLAGQLAATQKDLADLQGTLRNGTGDPLQRLEDAVSRIRGLKFKQAVTPELLTPAEFRQRIHDDFVRNNPERTVDATGKVLATLGVIPATFDLYAKLTALQEEQVAGFYDAARKKLVVRATDVKDPSPLTRVLLAHELTHALTDQWYDLTRIDALQRAGADDRQEAFVSLAEGDAQYTMQLYAKQVLTAAEQLQLAEEYGTLSSAEYDSAPKFLQDVLGFPYTTGLDFVTTLHDRGGFDLVDKAYTDPPVSTEQIMHPARYLDERDAPAGVAMPDVAAAMGSGWSKLDDGGVGEMDLLEIADEGGGQGISTDEARKAADGWDGGAYVGVSSGARTVVAVLCRFDSDSEAREAVRAFGDWLPLRYGNVGSSFEVGASDVGSGWESPKGAGEVVQIGTTMLLILAPSKADAAAARRAF